MLLYHNKLINDVVPLSFPQELLADILDIVDDMHGDDRIASLRSCSLVARAWTFIAQARLFDQVCLHKPTEVAAFTALLDGSPHIVLLVHRLSVEPEVPYSVPGSLSLHKAVILLLASRLPNLTTLRLHRPAFSMMCSDTRNTFAHGFQTVQSLDFVKPVFEPDRRQYISFLECCLARPCLKSLRFESDQHELHWFDDRPSAHETSFYPRQFRHNMQVTLEELALEHVSRTLLLSCKMFYVATGVRATKVKLTINTTQFGPASECLSVLGSNVEHLELSVSGKSPQAGRTSEDLEGICGHQRLFVIARLLMCR